MSCFILSPSHNIREKHQKVPIILSGVLLYIYSFYNGTVQSLVIVVPFKKLISIYCNDYYYGSFHLNYFYTYYLLLVFSLFQYISSTKNKKQHTIGIIWHTGYKNWTREQFDVQAKWWEQNWCSVGIWPVLKWLRWSSNITNQYYRDN